MSSAPRDTGPIEDARKSDRPQDAASGGRRKKSRFDGLWGALVLVGGIVAFVGYLLVGQHVRDAVLGFACDLSACSAGGMTTAGWLVIAAPATVATATSLLWRQSGTVARRVLATLSALVCVVALAFIPGRGRDMDDLLDGPGSYVFADGLVWGLAGAGAALLGLFALVLIGRKAPVVERRYNTFALATSAALMAAALPVAIAKSDPTWVRATELFPPVLTMNGDTLVRTSASDQRGCDGVLPDDTLLNRRDCHLTVRAAFTTDDSDSVVTFRAVLYSTDEIADEVRAGLPSGLTPVGVTGDARTVMSTTHSWVLIGAVTHADGRSIAKEERAWMLWPLRQVSYHFIGAQAGIFVDPDPNGEIRPRTP